MKYFTTYYSFPLQLQFDMVITGLYIPHDRISDNVEIYQLVVHIEDDVLITDVGPHVLSSMVNKYYSLFFTDM